MVTVCDDCRKGPFGHYDLTRLCCAARYNLDRMDMLTRVYNHSNRDLRSAMQAVREMREKQEPKR